MVTFVWPSSSGEHAKIDRYLSSKGERRKRSSSFKANWSNQNKARNSCCSVVSVYGRNDVVELTLGLPPGDSSAEARLTVSRVPKVTFLNKV